MRRLILRPGAIGDFIVSLPALESLRAGYTELWTTTAVMPLAGFADCVRPLQRTGIDTFGLPGLSVSGELVETLKSFDSIVSWYGANRPEFRAAMEELRLPVRFHEALPSGPQHATDFYLRQVGAPEGAIPRIPTAAAKRDFAVIHPFSGGARKNWPLGLFRQVAAALPLEVKWTAGPDEPLEGATRFGNLRDLAEWIAAARLYIGNDSGITHLAAAVGTPVVAIFGPTDPMVWAPRGAHARVIRNPVDAEAVAELARAQIRGD